MVTLAAEVDLRPATTGVSLAAIEQAAQDLAFYLPPTPLQYSRAISDRTGCQVHIKIEGVQPVRSFKVRGALNKIIHLRPNERPRGVITASAGNHGQGVAYAALTFGIPATVFMPIDANPLKVEAIHRLGAKVVHAGETYQDAADAALVAQAQSGATYLPAYDDADVIAGQGSVAVEVVRELTEFDTVIVPIGGGGLIAGITAYLKRVRPKVKIIGVEPTGAAGMHASIAAGKIVSLPKVQTIADGLAATRPGRLTFGIVQRWVDEILLVEDDEMVSAIRLYFEWEHLLAEPAGAAALAGLMYRYRTSPGERVVVILSGANTTGEVMVRALKSG